MRRPPRPVAHESRPGAKRPRISGCAALLALAVIASACSSAVTVEGTAAPTMSPTKTPAETAPATLTPAAETPSPAPTETAQDPEPDLDFLLDQALGSISDVDTAKITLDLAFALAGQELDTLTQADVDLAIDSARARIELTGDGWTELLDATDTPGLAQGSAALVVVTEDRILTSTEPLATSADPERPWTAVEEQALGFEVDPRAVLSVAERIVATITDASITGTEQVDGTETTAIDALVAGAEVLPLVPRRIATAIETAGVIANDLDQPVDVTLWLDTDGVLRQLRITFANLVSEAAELADTPELNGAEATLTISLAQLGEDIGLRIPGPEEIASPDLDPDDSDDPGVTDQPGEDILPNVLSAGDCFTLDQLELVSGFPIPCTRPHIAEIYHVTQYDDPAGTPFPGDDPLIQRGAAVCNQTLQDVVGVRGEISLFRIRLFRPSSDTWPLGDRELACFVQFEQDITDPLSEVDPLRSPTQVSPFGLEVGDCLLEEDLSLNPFTLVPCSEPHFYEVFISDLLPEGEYPGDNEIGNLTEQACLDQFEAFVGVTYASSDWFIEPLTPNEGTWTEFDDRLISCLLTVNELVSTTAAGSNR